MNLGIDLGTYNSAAAVAFSKDKFIMVESRYGPTIYGKNFPSFVLFDHQGKKQMVGLQAARNLTEKPEFVIWGVKRLIGLSYETAKQRGELKRFQYTIEKGQGGSILIKVGGEFYTPSHILEFILGEIKEDAENKNINPLIGEKIEKAVISIPAFFDATRTRPILDAARSAGFNDVKTIAEPTAAGMVLGQNYVDNSKVLVFDIGAGTLDVTIMLLVNEDGNLIAGELQTSGNEALGGIDMDDMLTSYIIKKHNLAGIENDLRKFSMLKEEIERVKIRLSKREKSSLDFPDGQSVDFTRKELEIVLRPLLEKCRGPIQMAFEQAKISADQIDHVLLVGGPANMPCIRETVKDELKKLGAKNTLLNELDSWERSGINPMECVAKGASLKACGFSEPDVQIDPNDYGINIVGTYYSIIPGNSSYPFPPNMQGIEYFTPEALRVTVSLVKKLPYNENASTIYKYFYLGDYDFYIKSTGENPIIDVAMELNSDKDLITTFIHRQTNESMRFEKLDLLTGNEISLQEKNELSVEKNREEEKSGKDEGNDDGEDEAEGDKKGGLNKTTDHKKGISKEILEQIEKKKDKNTPKRRDWSPQQFERAASLAQKTMKKLAKKTDNTKVESKKIELLELMNNKGDPNNTRFIFRRIQELLNILFISHMISESESQNICNEMREIENLH